MKLRRSFLLALVLECLLFSGTSAQVFRPIDPNKIADVDTKSLNLGEAQFKDVPQATREEPNAQLSKGNLKLQGYDTKQVDFQTLKMSTIEKPVLPQANFTAKHIASKVSDESDKNLNQAKEKAPITNRQIRPFTPGGEQELKKQLNEPH